MFRPDDMRQAFRPLNEQVDGWRADPGEPHFPSLSRSEYDALCNRIMDDLEQNYDGFRVFIDQYGDAHTEFIRREKG